MIKWKWHFETFSQLYLNLSLQVNLHSTSINHRKPGFILLLFFISFISNAQTLLSNRAEVSIITCGPYQSELYSAFGHSAIRIYDPTSRLDLAYNYGVFHFDSKFYLNFTRGYLFYKLGVYPYPQFRDYYVSENRDVHEQILNLSSDQKQQVFEYLYRNALPENAIYRYDYFYNNCATKVRDVFVELFKDTLKFDGTYINTSYTIRDLTEIYLSKQPWGDLGIDICLGLPMDKKLTPFEYMFLPDYVKSGFEHATINGVPIVKKTIHSYVARQEVPPFNLFHPLYVFCLFLTITLILSYSDWRKRKLSKWFDVVLFSTCGWIGILLCLLWVATDHAAAAYNYNLLWAFPLHAIAAIFLIKKRSSPLLGKYFLAVGICSIATLLLWPFLPQHLNGFLFPLIIALGLRALLISKLLNRELYNSDNRPII